MANIFKDPNPVLNGPPSQKLSGVRFKSPTVDNPNIELPNSVTDPTLKLPEPPKLSSDFSPNKFDPSSTAGNTSFVDPRTGNVGSVTDLQSKAKIDTSGVAPNEKLKASSEKLNELKSKSAAPKVSIPSGERIKEVKIKTPTENVTSVDKVKQKSLETYL